MRNLLIIAHGSRRPASNEEVRTLSQRIADMSGHTFDFVKCAFLELAEPSIPDGIRECAAMGSKEIVIMPYFLSAGRHVAEDIPREVEQIQKELPGIKIKTAAYLGSITAIAELMATHANEAAD